MMRHLRGRTIGEIVLYCVGGGTAFITTFVITFIGTSILGVYYIISAGVGYVCGFIVNFFFQDKVTFRSETFTHRKLILFFIVQCLGFAKAISLLYIFTEWIGLHYLMSLIFASGIVTVVTFSLSKWWVFRVR